VLLRIPSGAERPALKKSVRKALLVAISLLVSAAAVLYFLRGMRGQWAQMGQAFGKANYLYLVPAVGLIGLTYAFRVFRWRVFLNPIKKVSYSDITSATCIGFMATCVLPLRPGEIIRPYMLHRKSGVSFGHAAGTAPGLERVFDLIGTCFLLLLTFVAISARAPRHPGADASADQAAAQAVPAAGLEPQATQRSGEQLEEFLQKVRSKGLFFATALAAGLVALSAATFFPAVTLRVAEFFLRVLPASWRKALMGLLGSFVQAMGFLKSPGRVAAATLLSLGVWFCYPLSTYVLARGFGLDLPLAGALVVQSMVTVAVVAPQAPGFIGPFQAAATAGAELFGVSRGDAGAFGMMMWAVNVIPITIVGLWYLRREGLSLRRLAQASERAADQASGAET